MKNLVYLFFVILLFSCSQPKDKSGQEFKIEQEEMKKPSGSQSLACDCTCDCDGNVFTTSVYPCKNRELACEKACKQKCK